MGTNGEKKMKLTIRMKKNNFYVTPSMEVMKLDLTSSVLSSLSSSVEAKQIERATWDDLDE